MSDEIDVAATMRAKYRLIEIKQVPYSKDQPLQVYRKRNGVFLMGFKTKIELEAWLMTTSVDQLIGGVVTSRRSTR